MTTTHSGSDFIRSCNNLFKALKAFSKLIWYGVIRIPQQKKEFFLLIVPGAIFTTAIGANLKHLEWAHRIYPQMFTPDNCDFFYQLGIGANVAFLLFFYIFLILAFLGTRAFAEWNKYQKAIDLLGLKNALDKKPMLVRIDKLSKGKTKLIINSVGIGLDEYEKKKSRLVASSGENVETIKSCQNKKLIEVLLTARPLPSKCDYKDFVDELKEEYSFIVGESVEGPITQSIRELPHLLIAGTTGGGKSVFFKQAITGLLETSPHLQMYLLDLKGGVEFTKFEVFPNVRVAKSIQESLVFLRVVKTEMKRRFKLLKKNGHEYIEPKRDKLDVIVLGVDEASILYMLGSKKDSNYEQAMEARKITDEIAKLGRAAGIHLILATQRVTVKTIDTNIQENVEGRVCFRMNTFQGSNLVLGNKKAMELPDIAGRAIWAKGNTFLEVQAPYLDQSEILAKGEEIKAEFSQAKRKNLQELLVEQEMQNLGATSIDNDEDDSEIENQTESE